MEHRENLAAFFAHDSRTGKLPSYLDGLAKQIALDKTKLLEQCHSLGLHIENIKDIVASHQSYAQVSGVTEALSVPALVEDALQVYAMVLDGQHARIVRQFDPVPDIPMDKHRVLQILVNLVSNAAWALSESPTPERVLTIGVHLKGENRLCISVADNGIGISPENLQNIFHHGFSTRPGGHGFGLHDSILAAREMKGDLGVSSEGLGRGAVFTLELPASGLPN